MSKIKTVEGVWEDRQFEDESDFVITPSKREHLYEIGLHDLGTVAEYAVNMQDAELLCAFRSYIVDHPEVVLPHPQTSGECDDDQCKQAAAAFMDVALQQEYVVKLQRSHDKLKEQLKEEKATLDDAKEFLFAMIGEKALAIKESHDNE
jgi:uncharacterized Zn-finger protein